LLHSPRDLLDLVIQVISNLDSEDANSFAADLPSMDGLSTRELKPCSLPIVESINSIGTAHQYTEDLVEAIKNSYEIQSWRQPYTEKDINENFVGGSAWFPIADSDGPIIYEEGLVEIMLLGGGITYPTHSHSPEELYIVLAGEVWWDADGLIGSPRWKKAGETIHHPSYQPHALTAGDEPVLILSLWRGGGFEMPKVE